MKAYSMDLRERVLDECAAGLGTKAVAGKYSVSASWVRRLKQRKQEHGRIGPGSSRNTRVPRLDARSDEIRGADRGHPGPDTGGNSGRAGGDGRPVHTVGGRRQVRADGEKRPPGGRAGPPGREATAGRLEGRPTGPGPGPVGVPRRDVGEHQHGSAIRRSPKGQRLVCAVPHWHWKTTTFVAALRAGGMTTPIVIDGALTGDVFVAYAEQVLVPTLDRVTPW